MNAMDRFRRECTAFFEALEAGAQKPLVFGDGPSDGPVLMLVGESGRLSGGAGPAPERDLYHQRRQGPAHARKPRGPRGQPTAQP